MSEKLKTQFIQRLNKSFLDILVLRLIQTEPMWGYKIINKTKKLFGIKLGHGVLYPLLNELETKGYTRSKKAITRGRTTKIYNINPKGKQLLEVYYNILKQQLEEIDIKDDLL